MRRYSLSSGSLGAGLLLTLLLGACGGNPPGGMFGDQAVPVTLAELETSTLEDSSEFVGSLEASERVTLRPEVAGRVEQIAVENGDRVTPGQLLIQLNAEGDRAEVRAANANIGIQRAVLSNAEANLSAARADRKRAEVEKKQAEAELARQTAQLELQAEELERTKFLVEEGVQAQQQLDIQTSNYETAIASRNAAREAVAAAQAAIEAAEDRRRAAQATLQREGAAVNQALAQLNVATENLQFTRVRAPIAGVVGDIAVKVGDYVNVGEPLTAISANQNFELRLAIPAERAAELRNGLTVELLGAESDTALATGRISFVSPQVDPASQAILAKATFAGRGGLRDGQFVRARVIWQRQPGLLIPTSAVSRVAGQPFVFVVASSPDDPAQDIAQQKPVQLGAIQGNNYQVLSGLEPGDRLITSGILNLQDGVPIAPQAAEAAAETQESSFTNQP
ncbi:MAG: efflux RND transporter periplasmic adaptor subunit [Spirulinaceae cyanobacterium SM2_1_0]|nr:efflux RND transporter periplasmic adaptor subunit [Spirulinaceae cyanobacterium SM2_1_0]